MRIITDIREDIDPCIALACIQQVIREGKISHDTKGREYYCWAMSFITEDGELAVHTRQHRKSDCFLVTRAGKKQ